MWPFKKRITIPDEDKTATMSSGDHAKLIETVRSDNAQQLKDLLSSGADPNAVNDDGDTVLMVTSGYYGRPHYKAARILLDHGADVNIRANNGYTALSLAAAAESLEMVDLLLQNGAHVGPREKENLTQVMIKAAGVQPSCDVVKLCLDHGVDPNHGSDRYFGMSAIMTAVHHCNLDIVRLIIDRSASVEAHSGALRHAVHCYISTVKELPPDPHLTVRMSGGRLTREEVLRRHLDVIRMLVDHGADVNAQDDHGNTAMKSALKAEEDVRGVRGDLSNLRRLIEFLRSEKPDLREQLELLLKADKLNQVGSYEEAITNYDKVISSEMQSGFTTPGGVRAAALYGKGNSLMRLGSYKDAITYFDRSLEINSNFSMAWNNKGIVMIELGKNTEALHCFSKALEIDPKDKVALHNYNKLLGER